jgi:hypothetical protein
MQMRDRVSDRKFLLQKKVENRIENALGAKFRSGYAMVCYGGAGNVSYRNAWILSRVQVCLYSAQFLAFPICFADTSILIMKRSLIMQCAPNRIIFVVSDNAFYVLLRRTRSCGS